MTKYILKKDTPFYKKGTEFCEDWFHKGVLLNDDCNVVANLNELDNPDEWFEKVEESSAWKPKFDEMYYFLTNTGKVGADPWCNDELDEYRYSIGECFKTEKAAEAWRVYRIARATVSRDKGVLSPEQIRDEYLGEFVHYVVFNLDGQLETSWDCLDDYATPGTIYFDTMQHAQASLDKHPDEWKIIANYDWSRE